MPKTNRQPAPIHPELGEKIKRLRKLRGLSLRDLSEKVALGRAMLSSLEKGNANASIPALYRLADGLGVSPASLLDPGTEDMQTYSLLGVIGEARSDKSCGAVSLPIIRDRAEVAAFKGPSGYALGVPIEAEPPASLKTGHRVAFLRRSLLARREEFRLATYYSDMPDLSPAMADTILTFDATSGRIASAGTEQELIAMLQTSPMTLLDRPEGEPATLTPNRGWLLVDGAGLPMHEHFAPYASQLIVQRWRIIAELVVLDTEIDPEIDRHRNVLLNALKKESAT